MHVYIPYHARRHAANHAHVRIYINVKMQEENMNDELLWSQTTWPSLLRL